MCNDEMILAFIGSLGTGEIVLILIVALLIFGRRLPEVGKTVGKTLGQLRRGIDDVTRQVGFPDADFTEPTDDEKRDE